MLETVGVFEVPKQNGKYETGQVGALGPISFLMDCSVSEWSWIGQGTEPRWHL